MTRTVIFQQNGMHCAIFGVHKDMETAKKAIRSIFLSDLNEYCRHRAVIGVYELETFRICSGTRYLNTILEEMNTKMSKDRLIREGKKVYGFDLSYMTEDEKNVFLDYCGKTMYTLKEAELCDEC